MLSLITALVVAGCTTDILPTAEMFRAQYGKPDTYKVTTCGGGLDEFGKTIPKWKCLIWRYEGKGGIYFGAVTSVPDPYYRVSGCFTGTPRVTKESGTLWRLATCVDARNKDVGCNDVQLGVSSTDDFKWMPDFEDELGHSPSAAWVEWTLNQTQVCSTQAEARKAMAACKLQAPPAPPEPERPTKSNGPVLRPQPIEGVPL
jgi:hypothetical protein